MSLFNSAFENFKEKFRKIEKLSRNCVNLQGAIIFNKTCLNNGLYPKFVQINLRGKAVTGSQNIRGIQNEELLNEINKKSSELEETETLLENQKNA